MPLSSSHTTAPELKELTVPIADPATGKVLGLVILCYDRLAFDWPIKQAAMTEVWTMPATTARDFLCAVVRSWDLTAGGRPVPITPTGLLDVYIGVQLVIAAAVAEDMAIAPDNAPRNTASSRPAGRRRRLAPIVPFPERAGA